MIIQNKSKTKAVERMAQNADIDFVELRSCDADEVLHHLHTFQTKQDMRKKCKNFCLLSVSLLKSLRER